MRLRILAIALMALAFPVSAAAAPFGPVEDQAYMEADAFWGASPTRCGTVTKEVVPYGSLDAASGEEATLGMASQPPVGSSQIDCEIWVVEGMIEPTLSFIMRHEYGHLLGYGHEDPEMSGLMTRPPKPWTISQAEEEEERYVRTVTWRQWRELRRACYWNPASQKRCLANSRRRAERLRSHFAN
jgi:hypothetical protein